VPAVRWSRPRSALFGLGLAVNAERSPFGTSAYGVHRGGAHVNYGEAPADVEYDAFRARAKQILGEELLGIPAG